MKEIAYLLTSHPYTTHTLSLTLHQLNRINTFCLLSYSTDASGSPHSPPSSSLGYLKTYFTEKSSAVTWGKACWCMCIYMQYNSHTAISRWCNLLHFLFVQRAFRTHSEMLISRGQERSFGWVERPTGETSNRTLGPRQKGFTVKGQGTSGKLWGTTCVMMLVW